MQKYSDVVLDKNGKAIAGLTITAKTYPDGLAATIYGADGGPAVTSVITDSTGRFSFYAASGHYSVNVSGTGITPVDYNDIVLFDPNDINAFQLVDYAALRAYTGSYKKVFVTTAGIAGIFVYDSTDTTTADDGWYCIISGSGKRFKRAYFGDAIASWLAIDSTGVVDCSASVNALLVKQKNVRFTPGTYLFTSNMVMQSGTHIVVEHGAKLVFNGARMTSYLKSDITLQVDGEISSVGMTTAPAISGWPSDVGGSPSSTTNERGFIEFGGISSSLQSGFRIFGTGVIHGDWTGTPSTTNLWTGDLNFKGIAVFYANNVDVSGVEVYGFRGEAVYHYTSVAAKNIRFHDLYVHDVNFNGVNFNAVAALSNSFIENNIVDTAWQGVELSAGTARRNTVRNCVSHPVQLGGGSVFDVIVTDNDIYVGAGVGLNGINAAGNPASITGNVIASRNRIYNATQSAIYAVALSSFKAIGNTINGYATNVTASTNGYAISIDSNVSKVVVRETICLGAGAGANGAIRCLSSNASIKHTHTEDSTGNPVYVDQGPLTSATATQREYRFINGVGASGIGFETIYGNGLAENPSAIAPFLKTSAILTAVAGGEVGTYTIYTYKPTGSSTLAASFVIDNYGQPQPAQNGIFNFGISGKRWAMIYGQNVMLALPASATPESNGDMTFQLTSNTSLTIKVKGSDGTIRSASLTLA